jgi:hypothetical protein
MPKWAWMWASSAVMPMSPVSGMVVMLNGFLQIPHWLQLTVCSLVGQHSEVSSDTLAFTCTLPPFKARNWTFTN